MASSELGSFAECGAVVIRTASRSSTRRVSASLIGSGGSSAIYLRPELVGVLGVGDGLLNTETGGGFLADAFGFFGSRPPRS